eukprot:6466969-Prymnesium_polylepis.1
MATRRIPVGTQQLFENHPLSTNALAHLRRRRRVQHTPYVGDLEKGVHGEACKSAACWLVCRPSPADPLIAQQAGGMLEQLALGLPVTPLDALRPLERDYALEHSCTRVTR